MTSAAVACLKAGTVTVRVGSDASLKRRWLDWRIAVAEIVEPLDEDGKSITLALTFELFDSFAARVPLIEARAANEYWTRRIWRHADTLTTLVIARAYEKARSTQTYAVQRVARVSKGELAAMSELHRGWVEEPGNSHPYYYVLHLIK